MRLRKLDKAYLFQYNKQKYFSPPVPTPSSSSDQMVYDFIDNQQRNFDRLAAPLNNSEDSGWISPASVMAMDIAQKDAEDEQFHVHLSQAWNSFKV